jgi:O-antigen/teichoic acid export membrane protein
MSDKNKSDALHKHARRGWLWGAIDQFAQRGLSMLVGLVLARLLAPAAFGLIASVSIFLSIAQQVVDGGISQRVLQKKDIEDADYCALFWSNGVMSLLCSGLLVACSGVIARFYEVPQLRFITMAMAGIIFVMNAGRVQAAILARELRFRALSIIQIAAVIAGCVTGLLMAFGGCGVWAIIGQQAMSAIVRAGALWLSVAWRPKSLPSLVHVKDLYGYGLPVLFSQVFRTVAGQLINVLIAKRVSATALGFYDRGRLIPQNLGYSLANIFSRTNFPVLARLQYDDAAFKVTYLKFLGITSAVYFMIMTGLAVCAKDLIFILLGEKWLPCVWFFQANCVAFSIYVLFAANSELLRSKGRTGIFFKYNMTCAGLQVVGVLAGMSFGGRGMVIGDIIARAIACVPLALAVSKISLVTLRAQMQALLRPIIGAVSVAVVLLGVRLVGLPLWPRFVLSGIAGAGMIYLYWRLGSHKGVKVTGAEQ